MDSAGLGNQASYKVSDNLYINPKVYDFINWWNRNLKIILFDVDVFIRKLDLPFKFGQLTGYLVRNISMGKPYRKYALKNSVIPFFKAWSSTF